jgi:general secretion pathway protein D
MLVNRKGKVGRARGIRLGICLVLGLIMVSADVMAQAVRINFRDADIRSVIESVAEVTGKTFVLDPRVNGQITIISPEAIDSDLFYEAFLSTLQVYGFQAIDDGAVVRIVPFSQAFNIPTDFVGSDLITKVIPVDNVRATDLLAVVRPVLSRGSLIQAFEAGNHLVVTDTVSQVERLEDMLQELDSPDQSAVEIVNLEHISAGEALHIANQMNHLQQQLSVVEDSLNNRIIIGGPRLSRAALVQVLQSLDVPTTSSGGVEVLYLNYSNAAEVKTLLDGMLQSQTFLQIAGGGGETASGYRVEVDEDNNALVIAAPATVLTEIHKVIERLDRPRRQVLIEAVIAEVSETQLRNLSTQLVFAGSDTGGFVTKFDDLLPALIGGVVNQDISAAASIPNGVVIGGADLNQSGQLGFGGLIQALRSDSGSRILSTPSVVTLDNEEATLSVGREVPFVTGSYTNNNNNTTNPFQTIERQEVGVMLRVRPQVNEGSAVRMEIEQESSDVLPQAQSEFQAQDVVTAKRTITTNVMVGNNEVLVLGGLISDNANNSRSRVPLLGDIPLIGQLFRSSGEDSEQRVLMMFIRPTILSSPEENAGATSRQYDYIRTYQSNMVDEADGQGARVLEDFFGEPEEE